MRVETRTPATTGREVAPTVRRRRSKRLSAVLAGTVIVAGAAIGVLSNGSGSDGSSKPTPATVSAEPAEAPVVPFPVVPPSSGDGVSSADS